MLSLSNTDYQIRPDAESDDWRFAGFCETRKQAEAFVKQVNANVGWTKYRVKPC